MKKRSHQNTCCIFLLFALKASAFCTSRVLPSCAPPSVVGSSPPRRQVSPPATKLELRVGWPIPLFGRSKQGETDEKIDGKKSRHQKKGENAQQVRPAQKQDLPALKAIIDETDLFPSDMLDGMTDGFFNNNAKEVWLACLRGGDSAPAGLVYAKPEQMTDGTWNALLLAVRPDHQRSGVGRELMTHLEGVLKGHGHRLLLVETSGNQEYAGTRAFYERIGYAEEGRIRDFYQAGEDKVIYRKQIL